MGNPRTIVLFFTALLVVCAFTILVYQELASSGWRRWTFQRSYILWFMATKPESVELASTPTTPPRTTKEVWMPQPAQTTVVFLKTHKTASSTFQNIIYRFGEKHNLTFAFPTQENHFSYPELFKRTFVAQHLHGNHVCYDIVCNHMRFLAEEVASVVKPNAMYLSIVRQPEKSFESGFYYYQNYAQAFIAAAHKSKGKDPLRTFLENPERFYVASKQSAAYVKNPIAFDFGLDANVDVSSDTFRAALERVDAIFHLVMIADRFDESVILAKEMLHWDMDDVVYLSLNKRQVSRKTGNSTLQGTDPTLSKLIRRWNALDVALYDHFNNRFQRHVDAFGKERMRSEVDTLKKMCNIWRELCVEDEVEASKINEKMLKPYMPEVVKILGYRIKGGLDQDTREQCLRLLMPELKFHEMLFAKQQSHEGR
ncbi:unnamed protein product [Lampetra planeri]